MNLKTIICWLALWSSTSDAIVIEVDNADGHDSPSCLSENEVPCQTLDYALTSLTSSTTIQIHEGVYNINFLNLSFYKLTEIAIYGAGSHLTKIKCSFGAGLSFFSVIQLKLANFTFYGGGGIASSTLINPITGEPTVFRVALRFMDCVNVCIEGLVVTNSSGSGIVMHDVIGRINVVDSVFQFNKPLKNNQLGNGGVSILLTDFKSANDEMISSNVSDVFYNISNCTFYENNATSSEVFNPLMNVKKQFGHGGGLNFMTTGTLHNIALTIKGCNFTKNSAIWGGGLSIRLYGQPSRHQIILENVLFDSNYLPHDGHIKVNSIRTGGGAARVEILPKENSGLLNIAITFSNCTFQDNAANFGGGVSFDLLREHPISTTVICFINCKWKHNIARLGSALDAYIHPYPFGKAANLTIDSCQFINNTNHYSDLLVKRLGIGTLYLWSAPMFFKGKSTFAGNYGSAVVGIDTWFTFQSGSVTVFENNTAENGAAITLFDNSYLLLFEDIQLNFTYNKASGKGGAIHVITNGQRDLIGSQYCFISFHNVSVSPYEWKLKNIKVYFGHNEAEYGNSIFTTTLYACIWSEQNEIQLSDVLQVFYWNGIFMYEGVSNVNDSKLNKEISSYVTYVNYPDNTSYSIPPGKLYNFGFEEEDERKGKVDAVYYVTINDSARAIATVDQTESYTLDDFTMLHGKPGGVVDVHMVTVNSLPLSITVKVKLDDCPPGFYQFFESNSNQTTCKCSVNVPGQDYLGIIECDNKNLVAYLRPAHYAGYRKLNGKNTLLTAGCPEEYCYSNNSYLELPPNSSREALDNLICKPKHRTGILCGKCSEGNYIFVNSYDYKCGKCTNSWLKGALMLIGLKYIPLAIFMYFIGLFGISLVDGPLNAVVLFSQLLPYMNVYAGGRVHILSKSSVVGIRFVYGMWSLDFFELLAPNFCALPTKSALYMLLFKNLTPVLFGFILSCIYILVRKRADIAGKAEISNSRVSKFLSYIFCELCCKYCSCLEGCMQKYKDAIGWLNRKVCGRKMTEDSTCFHSQGLITCVVLCYVKLTILAFNLLSNTKLYGSGKDDSNETLSVFWLDGTLNFVESAPWTLPVAIVCIVFVILIPLTILFYPIVHNCYTNNDRSIPNEISVFCQDLHRLSYKVGPITRFFTAVYLCYRIGVLAIYAFTTTMHYQYLWQCGFFLTMLLIHCMVQPYKRRIYNIIDGIIFFNMSLISLLSLYRLYAADVGLSETDKAFTFQLILIYLPFVYIVLLWPCVRLYKFMEEKYLKQQNSHVGRLMRFIEGTSSFETNEETRQSNSMVINEEEDDRDGCLAIGLSESSFHQPNPGEHTPLVGRP